MIFFIFTTALDTHFICHFEFAGLNILLQLLFQLSELFILFSLIVIHIILPSNAVKFRNEFGILMINKKYYSVVEYFDD